ncbi:Imm1 family immunity protein [Actinokineospora sp. PR83]|uniref:Imm1 family immunity protein n=1 Tax=Actinokineospora sp. PR83 TaxID=2884908 RepID=UPI001EEA1DAD|nr:Imm1 family immunity protein [Actinokineospora sp. PR83]MCG8917702.1 Imm1 family immunity protein [Actinokineospora sp. PR83]
MTPPLTHIPFISMDTIPPGADLVAEVRALNEAGVEIPWAWGLTRTPMSPLVEQGMLTFGVHNEVGILVWEWGMSAAVPSTGTNTEWLSYSLAGLDESGVPPHAEVPVETVYSAVAEFLTTGERPTCVQWKEAASLLSQYE